MKLTNSTKKRYSLRGTHLRKENTLKEGEDKEYNHSR
jgi:hypothetical protein